MSPELGPSLVPALYAAEITHLRRSPIKHHFRYRASYWLVDYDEMSEPSAFATPLARFERADHSDVRAFLTEHGVLADRILMLAMPRTLGYVFNPISVFWCYDSSGERVAVLAEVQNTYGERHIYLLQPDQGGGFEVDKAFYVSPFYPVDGRYEIRVSEPGASVSVTVTLRREGNVSFVASLTGERRSATIVSRVFAPLLRPALRVAILIRWQGLRLWLRGLKVQPR